ncbi:MAG: NAD(P)/FAD-dependent oxidoreductase [Acidobacteria bacterium]|nr:NAD(P)/FAD-dependent oxidoreductase [Acidobacteriota bacterium]MBM4197962.1 NAD(P)/FAD-dependent oxidoreductase [Gammaproteobacteria bacterium]
MKRIAVLGGGPAGAFAAERMAAAGFETAIFDEKLAWEKPCGGGLTYKAYQQYPFLLDNATPKRLVTETVLAAPGAGSVLLQLAQPLVIYARYDLNRMLLERAAQVGARIEKARVLAIERYGSRWQLRTKAGIFDADFCIVATGARNPLRTFGTQLAPEDTMSTLGYYIAGDQARIDIQFLPQLEGYIWVFPRCGHLSVGICGKGEPAASLRARLERYMREKGLALDGAAFFSHLLPSLQPAAWKRNRVAGEGWLAVGDAAGLVDPITGEGLYYAMRSADLAAKALLSEIGTLADKLQSYRRLLRRDFAADLEFGSRLAGRVFLGRFLFGDVPARLVQFTRRSPRFADLMQDLFAGTQPYLGLRRRLLKNLNGSLWEIAADLCLSRLIPRRA